MPLSPTENGKRPSAEFFKSSPLCALFLDHEDRVQHLSSEAARRFNLVVGLPPEEPLGGVLKELRRQTDLVRRNMVKSDLSLNDAVFEIRSYFPDDSAGGVFFVIAERGEIERIGSAVIDSLMEAEVTHSVLHHKITKLMNLSEMNRSLHEAVTNQEIFAAVMEFMLQSWPFSWGYSFIREAEDRDVFVCNSKTSTAPLAIEAMKDVSAETADSILAECLAKQTVTATGGEDHRSYEFREGWFRNRAVAVPVVSQEDRIDALLLLDLRHEDRNYTIGPRESKDLLLYASHAALFSQSAGQLAEIRNQTVALDFLNSEMEKAVDQLKRAMEVKSRFVSTVSHELRTPLTSINSYTETMLASLDELPPATVRKFLGVILEESTHLTRLINTILDLSRLDAGKTRLEVGEVDLGAGLRRLESALAPLAQEKGIALKIDHTVDSPCVLRADHDKVAQILTNLTSNAIKYTLAGGEVCVGFHADPEFAVITVRDNGIGIPESDLPYIFDEFRKVERPGVEADQGTGLGLAITKRFVELHGGTVSAESSVGKGSIFTVCLPWSPLVENEESGEPLIL